MVTGITAGQSSLSYSLYPALYGTQSARLSASRVVGLPSAQPELPVQPVTPAPPAVPVQSGALNQATLLSRYESDPVALATRWRIQYTGDDAASAEQTAEAVGQPSQSKSPQEIIEEAECPTCAQRKYQDGSDDPGVSFKTAGHIDPDQARAVVSGHEQEHVVRERAKADRDDREVVSQSVTLHTAICPDCGRVYVSGGTTRTVTKAAPDPVEWQQSDAQQAQTPLGFNTVA